jgi:hypothetical protein
MQYIPTLSIFPFLLSRHLFCRSLVVPILKMALKALYSVTKTIWNLHLDGHPFNSGASLIRSIHQGPVILTVSMEELYSLDLHTFAKSSELHNTI